MSNVTINDIARLAEVSATTVSLAFREGSRIGDATRQRVLRIARAQQYVPNTAARNLRARQNKTIGIVTPDITDTYFASLAREAETVLQARGYEAVIVESRWLASREVALLEKMAQLRVQGVLYSSSETTSEGLEYLATMGIPYVMLDTCPDDYRGACVIHDFARAGQLVAEHLLGIGCRRPVVVTSGPERAEYSSLQRLQKAFLQHLEQAGVPAAPVVHAGLSIGDGQAAGARLNEVRSDVDAVFCVNDYLALGVIDALSASGRQPGRDVAVAGIDDLPVSRLSALSLTSVRLHCAHIAELGAARLLDGIIEQQPLTQQTMVPPELIVRDSTRSFIAT